MNVSDFSEIARAVPYLFLTGMTLTVGLTAIAGTAGLLLGTLLATMRLSPVRLLSVPAAAYVNLMRSIPLLLMIFWFYFLTPYIGAWIVGSTQPLQVGAFRSAVVSFTMFEAAYFCEIMRAGIQSIPGGQFAAGRAIGLTYPQVMGYVVLPQAVRNMVPPLLTRVIALFQDTSLVYVLSLTDFLGAATIVGQRDGRLTDMYLFVAATYLIVCLAASRLVRWLTIRTERRDETGIR